MVPPSSVSPKSRVVAKSRGSPVCESSRDARDVGAAVYICMRQDREPDTIRPPWGRGEDVASSESEGQRPELSGRSLPELGVGRVCWVLLVSRKRRRGAEEGSEGVGIAFFLQVVRVCRAQCLRESRDGLCSVDVRWVLVCLRTGKAVVVCLVALTPEQVGAMRKLSYLPTSCCTLRCRRISLAQALDCLPCPTHFSTP